MDGDLADCQGLATLRDQYGALLCLDEAHATLVYGENGGGVAEEQGVAEKVDVHVGTLSKAFGSHGGFVGCSSVMKRLLISKGRAGIYSTALPLPAPGLPWPALKLNALPRTWACDSDRVRDSENEPFSDTEHARGSGSDLVR